MKQYNIIRKFLSIHKKIQEKFVRNVLSNDSNDEIWKSNQEIVDTCKMTQDFRVDIREEKYRK